MDHPPATLEKVTIGKDGTVTQVYSNGIQKSTYQVALATVQSPDLMTPETGNVYITNSASGSMIVNTPGSNGLGTVDSASLGKLDRRPRDRTHQHDLGAARLRGQFEGVANRLGPPRRHQQHPHLTLARTMIRVN